MRRSRLCLTAVVAVFAVAGCGGGDDDAVPEATSSGVGESVEPSPTEAVTESAAPSPTGAGPACPNQESAVADEDLRQRGRLTGEMDGDEVADEVFLVVDRSGTPGCQAFVAVDSEGSLRTTPIDISDIPFEMGFPRLISMPLIDDRPGAEIVVGVTAGASTQFVAVYTAIDDAIVQVVRPEAASPQENLLGFGGSVGHQSAVDCAEAGEGAIVVSEAVPIGDGERFRYARRFFVPQSPGRMAEDPSYYEEGTVRFDRFDSLREFPNAPFGSCATGEIGG